MVWDGGLDEERVEKLVDYKAQRDPMPDDMELQLDGMVEYLEAAGWASVTELFANSLGRLSRRWEREPRSSLIRRSGGR